MRKIINTKEDLLELAFRIKTALEPVSLDTETTGLFPEQDKIVGFSLAFSEEEGYYIPANHRESLNVPDRLVKQLFELLSHKRLLFHNAKFDIEMVACNYGIKLPVYADTMAMAYLACFPKLALKDIMSSKFNYETKEFQELLGEKFGVKWKSLGYTSADLVAEDIFDYAIHDVLFTYALYNLLKDDMQNYPSIWKLELNLIPIVAQMNMEGLVIDTDALSSLASLAKQDSDNRLAQMRQVGGPNFEPNSLTQVRHILFEQLGLPITSRTKQGAPSTEAEVMEELSYLHEFPKQLMEYRSLNKYISGYLDKIPEIISRTNLLYANFSSIGADSGRFTCPGTTNWLNLSTSVNLQNQPVDDKFDVRAAYIVPEGFTWVKADYRQQEYRMMCNISGETEAIDKFKRGVDFHTATAHNLLEIPDDMPITKEQRQLGKVLNFGMSYGMTVSTVAKKTGHTEAEAKALYEKYFAALPHISAFIEWAKQEARSKQAVKTIFGRVRKLEWQGLPTRVAEDVIKKSFNTIIQGSCADLTKIAMLRVKDRVLDKYGLENVRLMLQVHDELDFYVRTSMLDTIIPEIQAAMTIPTPPAWVDFEVDVEIGKSWSVKDHTDWEKPFTRDEFISWGDIVPKRYKTYLDNPDYVATW